MLRKTFLLIALGAILLTPSLGHAQKKKTGPVPAVAGTAEEYALLNQQKEVRGTFLAHHIEAAQDGKNKRALLFRYDYEVTEANPNYKPTKVAPPRDFTNEIMQLQIRQANALQIPDAQRQATTLQQLAVQQQQLMMRIQQEQIAYAQREAAARDKDLRAGNTPYIKVPRAKEFELEIQDDLVIRRLKPALEYDDRGFLKEYTKDELEKLSLVDNADKKKPGYPAKYEDLMPKQVIQLALTPGKAMNSANADRLALVKPTVRMIVIVDDIPDPNGVRRNDGQPSIKKKK